MKAASFYHATFRTLLTLTGIFASASLWADQAGTFKLGGTMRIAVSADGSGPFKYQWKKNGADIAGATSASYTFVNAQASDAGAYSVSVTNAVGSAISDIASITLEGISSPSITSQPASQTITAGSSAILAVGIAGTPAPSVQWQLNGVAISGATSNTYTASASGSYTAVVTNLSGSVTSQAAIVTVISALSGSTGNGSGSSTGGGSGSGTLSSRLANVSIRTTPGTGAETLIVGFVTAGANKNVLVRAIGPGLSQYISSPVFNDPAVELYQSSSNSPLMSNDNWGGTAALHAAFDQVGAFALPDNSKDAALVASLSPNVYSVQFKGTGSGLGIAEIYDADTSSSPAGRIVNLSARTQVGTGDNVLVAGFVIAGNKPKKVLIRAAGPTLSSYGVPGALADPKLDLYVAGATTPIQSNDNWSGDAALSAAFTATGAFSFSDASSKDAAILVTLNPGAYSAVVSGVGNTTGVALVEIYDVE